MRIEMPAGTLKGGCYIDRFFHDEIPDIDLDFENEFVGELFRGHKTFPAFLPGIGDCPSHVTCEYQVSDEYDWVGLSPYLATTRVEFQGILDQVRADEEVGRKFEDIPFPNGMDDVLYWLNYAIATNSPECVIGWSVITVPDLVSLSSIPPSQAPKPRLTRP